jgi:hypothetical protein
MGPLIGAVSNTLEGEKMDARIASFKQSLSHFCDQTSVAQQLSQVTHFESF